MDMVVIFNGLGNQMSQYALYLSKKLAGQEVRFLPISNAHNGYELDRLFGIEKPEASEVWLERVKFHFFWSQRLWFPGLRMKLASLLGLSRYDENLDYRFHVSVSKASPGTRFVVGGWHSEAYFETIRNKVRDAFRFPAVKDPTNESTLSRIRAAESVSLHIRRGDFHDNANNSSFGSVCNLDFYRRAIAEMQRRVSNSLLVVFSNDPEWARQNISATDVIFVDWNHGSNSWIDMFLMSQCKHNIICNSSFSWWGAWLNANDTKIVVCPDRFVASENETEVFPKSWVRVATR